MFSYLPRHYLSLARTVGSKGLVTKWYNKIHVSNFALKTIFFFVSFLTRIYSDNQSSLSLCHKALYEK